jgi:universal stress protein A
VRFGKPWRELLDAARDAQADLLVLGVRGRGAVDIAFFGSTTNQVVRRAPCPVLTVRE